MISNAVSAVGSTATLQQPERAVVNSNPGGVVRFGVIGYGYWGPNIVRNLSGLETCQLTSVCDKSPAALKRASRACPGAQLTTDFTDVLKSPDIDAVAVVTPVWTHFELAKPRSRTASMSLSKNPSRRRHSRPKSSSSWPRGRT